jgi:ribonuclease P protein component
MRDRLALLSPGSLVVVRALPGAGEADHDQLARDLDAALQRLLGGDAPGSSLGSSGRGPGEQQRGKAQGRTPR